jgi:hypothetical protein
MYCAAKPGNVVAKYSTFAVDPAMPSRATSRRSGMLPAALPARRFALAVST